VSWAYAEPGSVRAPYDLLIVALPGGAQLELTSAVELAGGRHRPAPPVLYVPWPEDVDALRQRVVAAGVQVAGVPNLYRSQRGFAVP